MGRILNDLHGGMVLDCAGYCGLWIHSLAQAIFKGAL